MSRVVAQLQIGDDIEKKVVYRPALDGGVQMVANGEAEIGVYPASEVIHVKGIGQAMALPDALQMNLVYGAALTTSNPDPEPALAFIKFLSDQDNIKYWKDAGFGPAGD